MNHQNVRRSRHPNKILLKSLLHRPQFGLTRAFVKLPVARFVRSTVCQSVSVGTTEKRLRRARQLDCDCVIARSLVNTSESLIRSFTRTAPQQMAVAESTTRSSHTMIRLPRSWIAAAIQICLRLSISHSRRKSRTAAISTGVHSGSVSNTSRT